MRTSVTQLTPEEIDELLQICVDNDCFSLEHIERIEDADDCDPVYYHPTYAIKLVAADSGISKKEHLHFHVWVSTSFETDEADLYPYEILVGEITDYMGSNVANLQIVKWFLDHGFQLWPQSIEDAALAAKASGPELQAAAKNVQDAYNPLRNLPPLPVSEPFQHKPQVIADMLQVHVTEALEKIRMAGHNEDPTAQWMQKWAAHALNPNLPRPLDEPPNEPDMFKLTGHKGPGVGFFAHHSIAGGEPQFFDDRDTNKEKCSDS